MNLIDKLKLTPITVLDDYQTEVINEREVLLTAKVTEKSLNPYGMAHGGYLFTLADSVAGLTTVAGGVYSVTLQSNIHYMKAVKLEDTLSVTGRCTHDGSRTKVVEVTIQNQDKKLIATASFTMFVTGKVE
ncbi:PaaI family thioesterase [Streptococcus ruminantium]|uniref:PaaI family thioesterase n=1 Tax=Streptococcus ruminantium TaxID=1917441 RepID=A0ABU1B4J2_9STRE|nr:PaaI family thioesterase [Streptococcus ruminantium]MDQ8758797.1 PaaI family thioesterase [Streptococcus ruminantium]MDQ8768285.1 PaaI family thioesterase [Streptococcus ruminantium]MDQ8774635.1 PaaI family thioesterase [Streptococcus ruminantium]MDQ8794800.1 PaaI family thioesterase [Streptococcus ruminantium]MDQ8795512.1 PaaI family thioesterase [Streptococcus ruminantium]